MPFARIITRFPEHASNLSQQLQLEGYQVEITAPGELHEPADLEIDFALCSPAQAFEEASRQAAELGADVVVAPGVLELAMQSQPAPAELQPEPEVTQPEVESVPVEMASAEAIPSEPVTMQHAEEDLGHELPSYNPHFARNLGVQLREALTSLVTAAGELRKHLVEHLKTAARGLATRANEYQAQIKQKASERQAAREQQRAETAGAQIEAQEIPVTALQATEPEPQFIPEPTPLPTTATVQETPGAIRAFPASPGRTITPKRRTPLQLRGIFTGAAAASILFMVGLILANVHQLSPLPPSMTQPSVEQHVPFGAIIVQGAPAHANTTTVTPPAVAPAPKPQSSTSSQNITSKKPHPYHRRASVREADDVTTDDVTVRHFPSSTPRRPVQQQAKFKRYSDLD